MREKHEGTTECPKKSLIRVVELVQEKWLLLIVDRLLKGPTGFNDLSRKAEAVNVTTLSQRLGLLEREGLVVKTIHSTMPPRTSYELTDAGRALQPVLEAIEAWSEGHLSPQHALSFDCEELLKPEA
jgi:DNA-binding HxlR family transcriptional regulator